MERSRNGTLMSLNSQDFENLESVEELYFGERETEDNQEPENFFLEESSSEREKENDEANSCIEISPHVRESGFRNPGIFCLWNSESWALESGIQH